MPALAHVAIACTLTGLYKVLTKLPPPRISLAMPFLLQFLMIFKFLNDFHFKMVVMNNDLLLTRIFEKALKINCKSTLPGLIAIAS